MIKFFRNIRQNLLKEGRTTKYFKYAFGEIILVVIGILIALQVNNWNETRLEQQRITQYAKSLIKDLKNDIGMLDVSKFQADKKFQAIDSLRNYVQHTPYSDLSNTDLYVIVHDIMYRPYKWNRTTFNELKNSGGLRFISNDSLQEKLVTYESFSEHLDEDFEFDKSNAQKADDMIVMVLNLNSSHLSNMAIRENNSFNDRTFNLYETDEYKSSKVDELLLTTYDEALFKKFINTFIIIQDQYRIRANEMARIIDHANELILLLKTEYQL